MLLNENYFDDLKLTDDDIESPDNDINLSGTFNNKDEMYRMIQSVYDQCLLIEIKKKDILLNDYLWDKQVLHLLKKLKTVFEIYGIEYSEPVLSKVPSVLFDKILLSDKKYELKDFHKYYKHLTYDDSIKKMYEPTQYNIFVLIFFKSPVFSSYTSPGRLVGNIMKCLWHNTAVGTEYERFMIWNYDLSADRKKTIKCHMTLWNPIIYPESRIKKTKEPDDAVIQTIKLFFPERDERDIYEELKNNDALLNKLYGYFTHL